MGWEYEGVYLKREQEKDKGKRDGSKKRERKVAVRKIEDKEEFKKARKEAR